MDQPTLTEFTPGLTEIADGLAFPEGPIWMPDGSVVLVEMFGPRLTKIHPDGSRETIAEIPGGPNGAAVGPDGAFYLCNNGGSFTPLDLGGLTLPTGGFDADKYLGGRIQRVDPHDGTITDLYTACDGRSLRGPNDLVMDGHGGFWFTDHGIRDEHARTADLTGVYYAHADGSGISEAVFPTDSPNGIGMSPDTDTLYWAETYTGRLFQRSIVSPGQLAPSELLDPGVLYGFPGYQFLDSLAVDGEGWVCVATIFNGGITAVSPDGSQVEHYATGDLLTTNICFGGEDLRTAYVTCSSTGRLVSFPWPRQGLRLAHQ